MLRGLNSRVRARVLGRTRSAPFFDALHRLSLVGLNYGADHPSTSGELWALDRLARRWRGRRVVVADGGANVGDYAAAVLDRVHDVSLHCFEPSPTARALLESRLAGDDRVTTHPYGLGAEEARVPMYADADASGIASVHRRRLEHHGLAHELQGEVRLRRLDDVCGEEGIERIDLLKLDVEGHELAALHGAERLLREDRLEVIQFEFGGAHIDSRVFFQDFFYLLEPQFRIYRLMRDGVTPVSSYRERDEVFITSNFLCVARTAPEL